MKAAARRVELDPPDVPPTDRDGLRGRTRACQRRFRFGGAGARPSPIVVASHSLISAVAASVPLSALGIAKTALCEAMRQQGVGRAELARRLRWHLPQVNRVLDGRHNSRMGQVEAALAALGLRLIVDVVRAA